MSEETTQPVDLEAFAKKVAEETAAKIAMKQAEQKAAEEAVKIEAEIKASQEVEAKAQQEEEVKTAIESGVESGAERLMEDIRKEFEDEKVNTAEVINKYKKDLEEGGIKELHIHIKDGKSAKEIAKLMKFDVKTIQKLMN